MRFPIVWGVMSSSSTTSLVSSTRWIVTWSNPISQLARLYEQRGICLWQRTLHLLGNPSGASNPSDMPWLLSHLWQRFQARVHHLLASDGIEQLYDHAALKGGASQALSRMRWSSLCWEVCNSGWSIFNTLHFPYFRFWIRHLPRLHVLVKKEILGI